MTIVMLCPCLFSVTASAVVGGQDVTDEFHRVSFEEMKNMSQEELAEYCRELASQEKANVPNLNPIQPFWSSESYLPFDPNNMPTSATHFYITAYSILILAFTQDLPQISKIDFTEDDIDTILKYSERPDRLLNNFLWVTHFYDPQTGKNYFGDTHNTAKTSYVEQYNKAVKYLKDGNRQKAMEHLGMSLHFIQDVCEPHHSNNKTSSQNKHSEFEAWVGNNLENIEMKANLTGDIYGMAEQSTHESLLIKAAWSCKDQLNNASNTSTFRQAAEVSIGNAVAFSTMAIYYFVCKNGLC